MILRATKFFLALLLIGGFYYINGKLIDPDLGWHLRVGQETLATLTVPHTDHFTWTMAGYQWVDHEWLPEVFLWWMREHQLWWAVIMLFTALVSAPFLVWFYRAPAYGETFAVFTGAMAISPFAGVRSQMISFFLFFLLYELLRKKVSWWIFPVLFFIWANLHAGFAAGLALFGIWIAFGYIQTAWERKEFFLKEYIFPFFSLCASAFVALINPYGWQLYAEILRVMFSSETAKYILEWQPMWTDADPSLVVFLGATLIFGIRYYRAIPPRILGIAVFFLLFAVRSIRNIPLFILGSLPMLFVSIQCLREEAGRAQSLQPWSAKTVKALYGTAIVFFALAIGFWGWFKLAQYGGFAYPSDGARAALNSLWNGPGGDTMKMLNYYGWGGWLEWNFPEKKAFIDGRMPHWKKAQGNSAMEDFTAVFYGKDTEREEALLRRQPTMILMPNFSPPKSANFWERHLPLWAKNMVLELSKIFTFGEPPTLLTQWFSDHGWHVAFEDNSAVILTKE